MASYPSLEQQVLGIEVEDEGVAVEGLRGEGRGQAGGLLPMGPLLGLPLVLLAQAQAEVLAAELQTLRERKRGGEEGVR